MAEHVNNSPSGFFVVSVCLLECRAGPQLQRDVSSVSAPRRRAFYRSNPVIWQKPTSCAAFSPPAIDGVTEPLEIAESGLFNISWDWGLRWQLEHADRLISVVVIVTF